jgi:hypothetical protein
MINKVDAIRSLFKGLYHKATADKIDWKDGHETTDEENSQIDTEYDRLVAIDNYQAPRKAEYPSIEECVHAILDDDLENLQILRQAVKEKFPKP